MKHAVVLAAHLMREDLIYGIHVIQGLLSHKPELFLEIYVTEHNQNPRILELLTIAKHQGIAIQVCKPKQLDDWLPRITHQDIAARVRPQPALTESDLSEILEHSPKPPLLLILDGVQDPHNLGACIRTADAVGVTAVVIPKDKSVGLTSVVRKVASGAAETIPIVQVTNLARALKQLKTLGVWIMGTSSDAPQSLFQTDLTGPVAIVLGAEGTGLRRLTAENCDLFMHIPMKGVVESLNVSVAAGACLYETLRQRGC